MKESKYAVELIDLVKTYKLGKVDIPALRGVNLKINRKTFSSIIGPSGSGKSTAMNMIGGIDDPTSGTVIVDSIDLSTQSDKQLATFRARKIGFIFQSFNLIPVLNVFENVAYPMRICKVEPAKIQKTVMEMLELVGLGAFEKRRPNELSGGQQQRVAIARALVMHPTIVVADEPTANLDSKTSVNVLELMKKIKDERGVTFIFCTHDPIIVDYADTVYHFQDGVVRSAEEKKSA